MVHFFSKNETLRSESVKNSNRRSKLRKILTHEAVKIKCNVMNFRNNKKQIYYNISKYYKQILILDNIFYDKHIPCLTMSIGD